MIAGAVPAGSDPGDEVDHRTHQVGFVDVVDVLQNARDTLDAHAGVDVLARQRPKDLEVGLAGALTAHVLHEDEVPDFDVTVLVGFRAALDAVVGPAVEEDLRARTARPGNAHRPVVVGHAATLDPLGGHADLVAPDGFGLIVVEVDRRPQQGGIDAVATVGNGVGQQRPRKADGFALEVVAEGEIARHLEERVVAGGDADFLDVRSPDALLDAGLAVRRRGLITEEVRLERDHTGVDEQQVGVVEDDRCARHLGVARVHEVIEESLPDLVCLHVLSSLGHGFGVGDSGHCHAFSTASQYRPAPTGPARALRRPGFSRRGSSDAHCGAGCRR